MFPIIELSGPAFERGRTYGAAARTRIAHSIATYARQFAYCGIAWQDAQALAERYRGPIGNLDAEAIEEMDGIAAGSGFSAGAILALNARTEILPPSYPGDPSPDWSKASEANRAAGVRDWGECTAIAVQPARSATRGTLLAQNWDWLGAQRAAVVLLRIRESDGSHSLAFTEAGILAKIGLNDRGLGLCLNLMRSTDDGRHPGIPVHVLLRAMLKCASVGAAIGLANSVTHGASSNILCADRSGETASLEISPRGVGLVRAEQGMLCHTNHFLQSAGERMQAPLAATLSTVERYERIRALAADAPAKTAVADVQAMLRDESQGIKSICRHPDPALPEEARVETVAGVVMELAEGVMHVAPDVPSKVDFEPVTIRAAAHA